MIAICEPQCIGSAHEAVNSGFLHGVRLAYPEERIIFFADQSHIDAIARVFAINNIAIDNIEYRPIKIRPLNYFTFSATVRSYFLFKALLSELMILGIKRLLLLSISSDGLYGLKMQKNNSISYSIAIHAVFEWITDGPYSPYKTYLHRKLLNFKRALQWRHSNKYKYVVLSPHILVEANKHIDIAKYNISAIFLPFIFSKKNHIAINKNFVTFATIGQGEPQKVYKIASVLNSKLNLRKYEIRIIGAPVGRLENVENIICVSPHKKLTRDQIEEYITGVDIILMLYDKDLYKLTCSGALFETFAYVKPIIFLSNMCVNYYNSIRNIGYECSDLDSVIEKMEFLINNYAEAGEELSHIKNNILALRSEIDIINASSNIREILSA